MIILEIDEVKIIGQRMREVLDLHGSAVGVRFLGKKEELPDNATILGNHRYCQAIMKARKGENLILKGESISCPAAASAFGLRPLPEGLKSGKGLVGFGIVSDETVGKEMFKNMPRLKHGQVINLYLFPLEKADQIPDIIIVEDNPEKLMWISLAYLNAVGGERVTSSTAILQATCVDSTIIPFLEQRLNLGYGCYGCRDATDLGENEAVIGFPGSLLPSIMEHLEFLGKKAIPISRSKKAYSLMEKNG